MEFNLNELKRKRYVPAKNTVFGDAIFLVLSALRDGKYHHIETTPKFPVSVDEFLMNGRTDFVIGRDFGRTFKAMDADTSDPSLSVRWFDASGKQHDQSVSGSRHDLASKVKEACDSLATVQGSCPWRCTLGSHTITFFMLQAKGIMPCD